MDHVVLDDHAVRRDVALARAVEVRLADVERIDAKLPRDVVDDAFDRDRALRSAKAAKRGIRLRVGLARQRQNVHVGQVVRVVEVTDGACAHRPGEVRREAGTGGHLDLRGADQSIVPVPHLVIVVEAVALARGHEVVVPVEPDLDRHAQPLRRHRRDARVERRLRLLAPEAAAHPPHLDRHLVGDELQRVRDDVLHLGRMLRRAVEVDAPVFLGQRVGDLPLEIELLLPADVELAAHAARCGGHRRVGVAALEMHRRQHVRLQALRFLRGEHRGQHVVVDLGEARGAPRGIVRRGDHDEHRLADVLDEPVGEDRVVVDDRPAIVLPGDVGGREHRDHFRRRAHCCEVDRPNAGVRLLGQPERCMEGAGDLRDVVDVERLAGDVQMRRFVRMPHSRGWQRCLLRHESFGLSIHSSVPRLPTRPRIR